MRIPTYRAQVSPTGEAPGQPIRTRYNANIAVQSQLDKAKPLTAALQEIGEVARVRYEMARDNLLNEATLSADEKIFEAYNLSEMSNIFELRSLKKNIHLQKCFYTFFYDLFCIFLMFL